MNISAFENKVKGGCAGMGWVVVGGGISSDENCRIISYITVHQCGMWGIKLLEINF